MNVYPSTLANCDFDKGTLCNWRPSTKSTFLWSIGSGQTNSGHASGGMTGPTADFSGSGEQWDRWVEFLLTLMPIIQQNLVVSRGTVSSRALVCVFVLTLAQSQASLSPLRYIFKWLLIIGYFNPWFIDWSIHSWNEKLKLKIFVWLKMDSSLNSQENMRISNHLNLRQRGIKPSWSATWWLDNSACASSTTCMGRTLVRCQYTGEDFLCGKRLVTMEIGGLKARLTLTVVCLNTR